MVTGQTGASDQRRMEPRLGLVGDVVDELRWTVHGRKGWLTGVVLNLILAYAYLAVTQGDPRHFGDIKSTNVGLVVIIWTLASTINTNQLGNDCDRVVASLEAGDSVPRILALKNIALAIVLMPLALVILLVHHLYLGTWHGNVLVQQLIYSLGAIFTWQGVGNVISVLYPFRPLTTETVVKARPTWVRHALGGQALPYVCFLVMAPIHVYWVLFHDSRPLGLIPTDHLAYPLVYLGFGLFWWLVGLGLATLYARVYRSDLIAALHRDDWAGGDIDTPVRQRLKRIRQDLPKLPGALRRLPGDLRGDLRRARSR